MKYGVHFRMLIDSETHLHVFVCGAPPPYVVESEMAVILYMKQKSDIGFQGSWPLLIVKIGEKVSCKFRLNS